MKTQLSLKKPDNLDEVKAAYNDNYLVYYEPLEELLNATTHAIGAVFGLIGLIFLLLNSQSPLEYFVSLFTTTCFSVMYLCSTLYHAIIPIKAKKILRQIDYSSINLMVLACGAAACLLYGTIYGYVAFSIAVFLTLTVAFLCFKNFRRYRKFSVVSNTICGILVGIQVILCRNLIPAQSLYCFLAGIILILIGFAMFGIKLKYIHTVFHVFILAGTVCLFFSSLIIIKTF